MCRVCEEGVADRREGVLSGNCQPIEPELSKDDSVHYYSTTLLEGCWEKRKRRMLRQGNELMVVIK